MISVVILHCSNIYAVSGHWILSDPNTSIVFDLIHGTISTFAMPTFFLIAGFFSLLTLNRYGPSRFLKTRMKRLGIP